MREDDTGSTVGEQQASLASILFSFFAIEARLNEIIFDKLPTEFKEICEKMSIETKMRMLPYMIKSQTFDIDGWEWSSFKQLKDLRDTFVHAKSEFTEPGMHPADRTNYLGGKHRLNLENAKFACDTASVIIKKLERLCGIDEVKEFDKTVGKDISKNPIN